MSAYDFYHDPAYASLTDVLARAHQQAASGKGAERHACSRPFTEQPMQSISELLGNSTGLLYQAIKKIQESQRLPHDAAVKELLGAINYIAGDIIFKESKQGLLQFPRSSALKAQWEAEQREAARPNPLNTLHPPAGAGTAPATEWMCYHGETEPKTPGTLVRIGDACPVCFASQ